MFQFQFQIQMGMGISTTGEANRLRFTQPASQSVSQRVEWSCHSLSPHFLSLKYSDPRVGVVYGKPGR
jgi:hypothetical protein